MTTTAREMSALLSDLLRRERAALSEFLIALADFDERRLWVELGHASLFSFLTRDLGLSAGAAYYRKTAAELVQKFPEVIEPLRDGRLCFTSIVELSKNITPENADQILPRFFHVSKREAKAITAELQPAQAVPRREVVTAVRAPVAAAPALELAALLHPGETPHANCERPTQEGPPRAEPPRMTVEPKTADESRVHITVTRAFLKKLEQARAALSHSHPGAGQDEILEVGLDLIIERHAKRRGLVKDPRKTPTDASLSAVAPTSPSNSIPAQTSTSTRSPQGRDRYIPADVRRAVWKRDGSRCQFPLASGGVCGSTHQLEIDHIIPVALGGKSTIKNCRVACRFHNDVEARRVFGDAWMNRFTG
jgi:hypothetical protein